MSKDPSDKRPAFQFYPNDWLQSERLTLMTLEEEGAYIRLLCYCWNHGSIPSDPEKLSKLIGKGSSTTLASVVASMFQVDPNNSERLIHDRLKAEELKQDIWREKCSKGGKKSGESRNNDKNGSKGEVTNEVNHEVNMKGSSTTLELPLEVNHEVNSNSSLFSLQSSLNTKDKNKKIYSQNQKDDSDERYLFDKWNSLKIIQHREFEKYKPHLTAKLKKYSVSEIEDGMVNYKSVIDNSECYFDHRWPLTDFLSRKNAFDNFLTVNNPFDNYKKTPERPVKGTTFEQQKEDQFKNLGIA